MIWTIAKALFTLIPYLVEMYREGRIKTGAYEELEHAISASYSSRISAAILAKNGELIDEDRDPNNRARDPDQLSVG